MNRKLDLTGNRGNDRQYRFSIIRQSCLWLATLAMAGCLQMESAPDGDLPTPDAEFEDPGPLTGSTSTANYPPIEAGGDEVHWNCGQELLLQFREFGSTIAFTGDLEIYRAGAIPVLGPSKTYRMRIASDSQAVITPGMLDSLGDTRDTVAFTVIVTSPSRRTAIVMGLSYSRSQGRFSDSALPFDTPDFAKISQLIDCRGRLLNGDSLPPAPGDGLSRMRYYIPGTPFYGEAVLGTTFQMDDVAAGVFPFRLLRVTESQDSAAGSQVEIFEVVGNGNPASPEYRIGSRVVHKTVKGHVELLDPD